MQPLYENAQDTFEVGQIVAYYAPCMGKRSYQGYGRVVNYTGLTAEVQDCESGGFFIVMNRDMERRIINKTLLRSIIQKNSPKMRVAS